MFFAKLGKRMEANVSLTNILTSSHNAAYWLLISPFKFRVPLSYPVITERCIFQALFCAVLATLGCFYSLHKIYLQFLTGKGLHDIFRIFKLAHEGSTIIRRLLMVKFFWLDQNKVKIFMNCLMNTPRGLTNTKVYLANLNVCRFFLVIHFSTVFIAVCNQNFDVVECVFICVTQRTSNCNFVKAASIVPLVYCYLILATADMFLFVLVFVMWAFSSSFKKYLRHHNGADLNSKKTNGGFAWGEIKNQLKFLRNISDQMNNLFGHWATCCMIEPVLFYAIHIEELIAGDEKYKEFTYVVHFIIYFGLTWVTFGLSAEIPRNIGNLKGWLFENENRIQVLSSCQIGLLWHQLESNFFGCIKASNVYPVTYGYIGAVSNLLVINM